MAPVGVPVRVHEGGAQFSKKDKRERRSLDLDPSQRRQNTDGSGDREGVDKPDTPQPSFGSRSPLPKRLKMRLERPEVPAEDIAARVDARLAAAERKREVRASFPHLFRIKHEKPDTENPVSASSKTVARQDVS